MDKFNKYAIITMVVIVAVLLAMAYIGYQVGGNAATDDKVNDKAGGGKLLILSQSKVSAKTANT